MELGEEDNSKTVKFHPSSGKKQRKRDVSSSVLSQILYLWHINKERIERGEIGPRGGFRLPRDPEMGSRNPDCNLRNVRPRCRK